MLQEKSKIGDLEVDAIIERTTNLNSDVTEYPVEDGFPVADHVSRQPITLSMTVVCTPTPVVASKSDTDDTKMWHDEEVNSLQGTADKLHDIYKKGEPIVITTPDAIYKDMIMVQAPLPRSVQDGVCYKMALEFKHVRIVKQKTSEVSSEAEGQAGDTETSAGSASQTEIGTGMTTRRNQSIIQTNSQMVGYGGNGTVATGAEVTASSAAYNTNRSFHRMEKG